MIETHFSISLKKCKVFLFLFCLHGKNDKEMEKNKRHELPNALARRGTSKSRQKAQKRERGKKKNEKREREKARALKVPGKKKEK